jgi:hypothetical protein
MEQKKRGRPKGSKNRSKEEILLSASQKKIRVPKIRKKDISPEKMMEITSSLLSSDLGSLIRSKRQNSEQYRQYMTQIIRDNGVTEDNFLIYLQGAILNTLPGSYGSLASKLTKSLCGDRVSLVGNSENKGDLRTEFFHEAKLSTVDRIIQFRHEHNYDYELIYLYDVEHGVLSAYVNIPHKEFSTMVLHQLGTYASHNGNLNERMFDLNDYMKDWLSPYRVSSLKELKETLR